MALTAKFQADFASFYDAVQKAEVSLKSFETGAGQVEKKLTTLGNSFSGVKIIQEAHLMTRAMLDAGGTASLTDKELKKLAATVGEASEKMRKLGQEVPPGFQKITDAAKAAEKPLLSVGTAFGLVAGAVTGFIALNAVRWFTESTKAALAYGDQLTNLHAKTDLTYRDLQILEDVGIEASVSVDALAVGVQRLQQKLGDGTGLKGIQDLGLSFDRIKQLNPGEQFTQIATALGKITDPTEFATRAAAVFGNTWREIAPALKADLADIAKNVKLVGDAQIEAADRAGDRWDKFWSDSKRGFTNWLGNIIIATEEASKRFDEVNKHAAALSDPGIPKNPTGPQARIGLGAFVNDVDPEMISQLNVAGKTLEEQSAIIEAAIAARAAFAKITRDDAVSAEFQWQRTLALTKFQLEQVATIESRLLATRAAAPITSPNLVNVKGASDFSGATFAEDGLNGLKKTFETPSAFSGLLEGVPLAIQAAITGGGSKIQAAGSALGMSLLGKDSGLNKTITKGIDGLFGKDGIGGKIGATLGATIPILGSLLGPALQGLTKLFGKSEESAKVSPLRDQFFKDQGGLAALNAKLGTDAFAKDIFASKTVEQYEKAVRAATQALAEYDEKTKLAAKDADALARRQSTIDSGLSQFTRHQQQVEALAKQFHFSKSETDAALGQSRTTGTAATALNQFQTLVNAGFSPEQVLTRMDSSFDKLVQNAKTLGSTLPQELQPILQKMIEMGTLTDASGKKIEDLADINFGKTLPDSLNDLTKALLDLTAAITGVPATIPVPAAGTGRKAPSAYDGSGINPGPYGDIVAHTGGYFDAAGFKRMHAGGPMMSYGRWAGLRGGEVPFIGKVGEGVLNEHAMRLIGQRGLHELNRGFAPVPTGGIEGLPILSGGGGWGSPGSRDHGTYEELFGQARTSPFAREGWMEQKPAIPTVSREWARPPIPSSLRSGRSSSAPTVHVDARGAYFDGATVEKLATSIRQTWEKDPSEGAKARGSMGVRSGSSWRRSA